MAKLLADEAAQGEEAWWWLSFATDEGFLGGALVKACGMASAVDKAHLLKINPGGEVAGWQLPGEPDPDWPRETFVSKDEVIALNDRA